jgi:hypothetical protein
VPRLSSVVVVHARTPACSRDPASAAALVSAQQCEADDAVFELVGVTRGEGPHRDLAPRASSGAPSPACKEMCSRAPGVWASARAIACRMVGSPTFENRFFGRYNRAEPVQSQSSGAIHLFSSRDSNHFQLGACLHRKAAKIQRSVIRWPDLSNLLLL